MFGESIRTHCEIFLYSYILQNKEQHQNRDSMQSDFIQLQWKVPPSSLQEPRAGGVCVVLVAQ